MKQSLTIIKVGGNIIDNDVKLNQLLTAFANIQGSKILVHGGGKLATQIANDMEIPQQMIDGRRITDEPTLKIVTMVYAGWINKNIVATLNTLKNPAIGITGADGCSILAHKRIHPQIDYGFVGDIDQVNTTFFSQLLLQNQTIVIIMLDTSTYQSLKNENLIFAGMIPKLDNAFAAIAAGVKRVIIGDGTSLEALIEGTAGTTIA